MTDEPSALPPKRPPATAGRLASALWVGALFGIVEGIVATALNAMPLLRAAGKASADQIWVTPLANLVYFSLLAAAVHALLLLTRRWTASHQDRVWWTVLLAAGCFTVLDSPGVLHRWSAALLALGLGVAMARAIGTRAPVLEAALRRRIVLVPVIIGVVAGGLLAVDAAVERARFADLPPAGRSS